MTSEQLNTIFDKYVVDWNNRFIKVLPNDLSPQCFDSIVKFTDLLGIPHYTHNPSPFPYENARQIYEDFGAVQAISFDRIPFTTGFKPLKGDIGVMSGNYNPRYILGIKTKGPGHVFVCSGKYSGNTLEAMSQNDPIGSNTHLRTFSADNLLGVLRPKVTNSPPPIMDKRPYWFDRISSVTFKKPHEQVTDADVEKFVSEYPGQLKRSGTLDGVLRELGFQGDTNSLTVSDILLLIKNKYDEAGTRKRTIEDCVTAIRGLIT